MIFSLKSIKTLLSNSEETICFTADLYIDGKKAFHVSNDGRGGCHRYYKVDGWVGPSHWDIEEQLKAASKKENAFELLDSEVNDLIEEHIATKELAKMLNKGVVLLPENEGGSLTYYKVPKAQIPQVLIAWKDREFAPRIVNGNAANTAKALKLI